MEEVDLGYLESVPHWKLHHRYFPSKVGGFPAWLDIHSLPLPADIQCGVCQEPTSFLMQIYAYHPDDPAGFHRTIFVFACRKSACMKSGACSALRVFRCCLPRANDFYSSEPSDWQEHAKDPEVKQPLCAVCGCLAPNTCASCKKVFYCGRVHQLLAWRSGHKEECPGIRDDAAVSKGKDMKTPAIFAEFEIVREPEELDDAADERPDDERLLDFQKTLLNNKPTLNDTSVEELETFCGGAQDKAFRQFHKRVRENAEQVLRYNRGGSPLLISNQHVPTPQNIPRCRCGSARSFEFQVMPQLLNSLQQEETMTEGLDFGTILVYTCQRNCHDAAIKYQPEFAWVQCLEAAVNRMETDDGDESD
ncbi:Programmed cell death protein 2 [Hypsibius exemplaris]|uniref:Programmed cell death protein 2 n=1 Tax=Hypsibius exemplaris TaxID=2072580 RepID=A0A1W0X9Y5_HYPEX|nr:Programmed cell death protein 2 [Hypsibius exemplaris]